jgi:hypothetical protein
LPCRYRGWTSWRSRRPDPIPSRSRPPASARSARDRSRAGPCGRATMFTGIGLKAFVTPPVAHDPSSRSAISARRVGSTIVTAR